MANYSKSLDVYIGEDRIGVVQLDDRGQYCFSYLQDYDSTPLSLSMPISNEIYRNKVVLSYLKGLLPDSEEQKQALARQHDVPANNPIALLNHIGLDCPGAVRFVSHDTARRASEGASSYVPLSREEIGAELKRIQEGKQASWQLSEEHWSLGGTQSKIALAYFGSQWYRCEGDAATTHIIKPGIARLKHQALNECICQNLAAVCGLQASPTSFELFDDVPALVSERFDRQIQEPKKVRRVHQEDFCQALSIDPMKKYTDEGGPHPSDILELLSKSNDAQENVITFTAQLFFNYLIGAPDAHGKNYSILLDGKGVELAPLYDCASALPYENENVSYKTAMPIGGERRIFHLRKENVISYAEQANLADELCYRIMRSLAERIMDEMDDVFARFDAFEGARELKDRMKPKVIRNCQTAIHALNM